MLFICCSDGPTNREVHVQPAAPEAVKQRHPPCVHIQRSSASVQAPSVQAGACSKPQASNEDVQLLAAECVDAIILKARVRSHERILCTRLTGVKTFQEHDHN